MAYNKVYITEAQYKFYEITSRIYTGFIIGRGYTYEVTKMFCASDIIPISHFSQRSEKPLIYHIQMIDESPEAYIRSFNITPDIIKQSIVRPLSGGVGYEVNMGHERIANIKSLDSLSIEIRDVLNTLMVSISVRDELQNTGIVFPLREITERYGFTVIPNVHWNGGTGVGNHVSLAQGTNVGHRRTKMNKSNEAFAVAAGVVFTTGQELYFSKKYNTWMGKNFKIYSQKWGGNGVTGGKNKFGRKASRLFKWGGIALGAYNMANIEKDSSNKNINNVQRFSEHISNIFSTFGGIYGAAWSIGWESGRAITNTEVYREIKFNLFYHCWERKFGSPSQSNEDIWHYFFENYQP